MKKILFLVVAILPFVSCNRISNKTSHLNLFCEPDDSTITLSLTQSLKNPTQDFGKIVDSAYVVALQATEDINSIIGSIFEGIVTDKYIYIRDNYKLGSVAIFTSEGNFVKRLQTGRGRGEVNNVSKIVFNKYNNTLLVCCQNTVNQYSEDGSFIVSYDTPLISDIVPLGDGYLIIQRNFQNGAKLNLTFQTDSTFAITKDIDYFILKNATESDGFFLTSSKYSSVCDDESALLSWPYHNIIYTYKDNSIMAKYLLDYPRVSNAKGYEDYMSKRVNGKYDYTGIWGQTYNYLYLQFSNYNTEGLGVYFCKKNHQPYGIQVPNNSIYGYGIFIGNYYDYFIRCVTNLPSQKKQEWIENSSQWLSERDMEKVKQHKDDNNPLLMFYKLKDE